jgi:hypothetical protein
MRAASPAGIVRGGQRGYALLMAMFLVATMIIMATVITPNILTEGRREREQEAIWRGNQYVRSIGLYYRKNGRYPQTVDDLVKGNLGVHFVRKAYADPTNPEDGSWRFIYVSPAGQLIGSVHYHSLQEMALKLNMPGAGQALPNPNGPNAGQQAGQQGASQQGIGQEPTQQATGQPGQQGLGQQGSPAAGQQGGASQGGQPDTGGQAGGGNGDASQQGAAQPGAPGQGFAPTQGAFASSVGSTQSAQPQQSAFGAAPAASGVPLQAVDGPVLGGVLIGVAGKVKRPSLIVYQGGKTYFDWEFIYNPLSVAAVGGQSAPGALPGDAGTPPITPPGLNGPAGTTPGFTSLPGNAPLGLPPITNTQER